MRKPIFVLTLLLALTASAAAQDKARTDSLKIDDDQTYLVLSTKRIQTMEKELDEAAAKGFRVLYGAPTEQWDMAILLRRVQDSEQAPYGYKVLATSRNKTMQKELNEVAKQGYRLLPRTIIFKQGFFTAEMVMLMEREPKSGRSYEYKLVSAGKETKLHKKIDEAVAEGFTPVTMITIGGHVVVMEKETAATQ
ncbi:MAG TPA: hypothetical protein VGP08_15840 [Pyrinomonadaceae bacterium]|nr:hypothetical protein [Pyrinomonadaceae bacterium]